MSHKKTKWKLKEKFLIMIILHFILYNPVSNFESFDHVHLPTSTDTFPHLAYVCILCPSISVSLHVCLSLSLSLSLCPCLSLCPWVLYILLYWRDTPRCGLFLDWGWNPCLLHGHGLFLDCVWYNRCHQLNKTDFFFLPSATGKIFVVTFPPLQWKSALSPQ